MRCPSRDWLCLAILNLYTQLIWQLDLQPLQEQKASVEKRSGCGMDLIGMYQAQEKVVEALEIHHRKTGITTETLQLHSALALKTFKRVQFVLSLRAQAIWTAYV